MKHAYLIMAHGEYGQLQRLISALDDERNDIYVHIDKKSKHLPTLSSDKAGLTILDRRIKVIWGHHSQIETEFLLLREAHSKGYYDYYHIISGLHYPIASLDEIDRFYSDCDGASVVTPMPTNPEEIKMKLGYHYYFLRHLSSSRRWLNKAYHLLWRAALWPQKKFGISRDTSFSDGKTANWCSISAGAITTVLNREKELMHFFHRTFCADEYLIKAIFKGTNLPLLESDRMLYVDFVHTTPTILTEKDYDIIKSSRSLFGRKFTDESIELINKINRNRC